jgi:UDP-3-O-[3-hydroxymyristoyl] N-acetylglucosamine deacetylase
MTSPVHQRTIAKSVTCTGIGLHSGKPVALTLKPGPVNQGICFVRTDLPNQPEVAAHFSRVVDTSLATVIGRNGVIVSTIEHLMATLAGLAIDNIVVELNSYEVPVMDGSAGPFTALIREAGIVEQDAPRHYFILKEPIELKARGKSVGMYPAPELKISCTIDFDHPFIGEQHFSLALTDAAFETEISAARTFGFLQEVEMMKRFGLARGGSLDNAVVIDDQAVVNEDGLRFRDEFVRHKLLDCIGDFSLLGLPMLGHLVVKCSGHAFNHAFLEKFFDSKHAWETRTLDAPTPSPAITPKALAN